jgi:hypothetical protein
VSSAIETHPEPRTARGTFWALVPVVLLVASVTGVGTLSSIAAHDPGFALEKNYYQRAVHWDEQQAAWARNRRLGYRVALEVRESGSGVELVTQLTDHAGMPVHGATVRVEAFANARAGDRHEWTLVERALGTYTTPLAAARAGLWEFRFVVAAGGEEFTAVERAEVPARSLP